MILLWLGLLQCSSAQDPKEPPAHPTHDNATNLICTPFGACEPCPADAVCFPLVLVHLLPDIWAQLNQPFCRPFGNRRLVHCVNKTEAHTEFHSTVSHSNSHHKTHRSEPSSPSAGELLAWESCGRIVLKERADFYEFVACNVAFAIISFCILFFRSRRIQVMQARQLAARIGIFREERRGARI